MRVDKLIQSFPHLFVPPLSAIRVLRSFPIVACIDVAGLYWHFHFFPTASKQPPDRTPSMTRSTSTCASVMPSDSFRLDHVMAGTEGAALGAAVKRHLLMDDGDVPDSLSGDVCSHRMLCIDQLQAILRQIDAADKL